MSHVFAYFVGVDWGASFHQVCILPASGEKPEQLRIAHGGDAVRQLLARLGTLSPPEDVAIAIESPTSPITEPLLAAGFAVHSCNPKQSDRFRDRFFPAGSKDDARDALVLAGSLRTDPGCFRRLRTCDPWLLDLRALSRGLEDAQCDVRGFANRLREVLLHCWPELLALCAGADEGWLWSLLEIAPTPGQARRLSLRRLQGLLGQNGIRRFSHEQLLSHLRTPALPLPETSLDRYGSEIRSLLPVLRALEARRREYARNLDRALDARIQEEERAGQPRDVNLLLSLPGVGKYVAGTLLAEAHEALTRRDYHALRAHAGVAPVTRASGKSVRIMMRRACSPRLRNAVYHWSRCSCQKDPRSREQYLRLRAAGKGHARALRGVADRLLERLCARLRAESLSRRSDSPIPTEVAA